MRDAAEPSLWEVFCAAQAGSAEELAGIVLSHVVEVLSVNHLAVMWMSPYGRWDGYELHREGASVTLERCVDDEAAVMPRGTAAPNGAFAHKTTLGRGLFMMTVEQPSPSGCSAPLRMELAACVSEVRHMREQERHMRSAAIAQHHLSSGCISPMRRLLEGDACTAQMTHDMINVAHSIMDVSDLLQWRSHGFVPMCRSLCSVTELLKWVRSAVCQDRLADRPVEWQQGELPTEAFLDTHRIRHALSVIVRHYVEQQDDAVTVSISAAAHMMRIRVHAGHPTDATQLTTVQSDAAQLTTTDLRLQVAHHILSCVGGTVDRADALLLSVPLPQRLDDIPCTHLTRSMQVMRGRGIYMLGGTYRDHIMVKRWCKQYGVRLQYGTTAHDYRSNLFHVALVLDQDDARFESIIEETTWRIVTVNPRTDHRYNPYSRVVVPVLTREQLRLAMMMVFDDGLNKRHLNICIALKNIDRRIEVEQLLHQQNYQNVTRCNGVYHGRGEFDLILHDSDTSIGALQYIDVTELRHIDLLNAIDDAF